MSALLYMIFLSILYVIKTLKHLHVAPRVLENLSGVRVHVIGTEEFKTNELLPLHFPFLFNLLQNTCCVLKRSHDK